MSLHHTDSQTVSASTYLAYKRDTNVFVTWLGSVAQVRGWRPLKKQSQTEPVTTPQHARTSAAQGPVAPVPPKGPRLKGKERKEAKAKAGAAAANAAAKAVAEASILKQANSPSNSSGKTTTKYTVSTGDLLEQIKVVSQENAQPATMPTAVFTALKRAIQARQKFSTWYQKTGCGTESSLESHTYFVDILRKALDLFRGSAETNRVPHVLASPLQDEKADVFIANMFEALELEDVIDDDGEGIAASLDIGPATLQQQPTKATSKVEYQLQENDADIDFAIFTLFEDIHRIRAETKEIFRRLANGNITLIHATVAIAAALELVKQADFEVHDLVCALGHEHYADAYKTGTYPAYVKKIYLSKTLGREDQEQYSTEGLGRISDDKLSSVELGPFDEFVLLPLGYTLDKIVWFSKMPWKFVSKINSIPVPMPRMRIFEAGTDKRDESPRAQKGEADDQFLYQVYREMLWIEGLKDGVFDGLLNAVHPGAAKEVIEESMLPYFDVLHSALRPVWTEQKIDMQSVFAAQTLIDMHDICGPVLNGNRANFEARRYAHQLEIEPRTDKRGGYSIRGVEDLRAPGPRALTLRLFETLEHRIKPEPLWLNLKSADMEQIVDFRRMMLRENISELGDDAASLTAGWELEGKDVLDQDWVAELTGMWPNSSSSFLQDTNLLYGGTALLDMVSMGEQAAVAIANENMSIMCMAHIYNAARQLGLLDTQWVELDNVIKRQAAALFANDIPTTPQTMYERWKYRMGFNRSSKGWVKTLDALVKGDTHAPWMMKPSQASIMIKQTLDAQVPLPRLLHWLEHETTLSSQQRKTPTSPKAAAAVVPHNTSHRQLTLRQTLQQIETHLDTLLPDIDYISLTRQCQKHLNKLRKKLVSRLEVKYDALGSQASEFGNLARVEMTYKMLYENMVQAEEFEEAQRKARRKNKDEAAVDEVDVKPVGRQLEYAARFLGKILSQKSDMSSQALEVE